MRAPAFSKAASAWNAPSPAPVSTSTSSPLFASAAAASGPGGRRRLPGAISRGTATFTGPRSWADGAIANGWRREQTAGAGRSARRAERPALDRRDAGVERAHLCMTGQGTWPSSAGGPRRLPALYALAMLVVAVLPARAATFGLDDVAERARRLAEDPFRDAKGHVPDWLLKISYDQWREIRFRPEQALWRDRGVPFQVQFFHPGLYYNRTVRVNVVEAKGAHPVEFSPNQFDYGKTDFASRVPQKLGYAGFRVHYPIKARDYYDEVIVFLGASYFRAVGKDEGFGLSARGLGIDTAESWGEEFPYFKEFWLVRPAPRADRLTVYALLDSPSLAGAYRFVVRPGEQTAVEVECRLFLRKEVRKLGIAPLTSMFFHGENTIRHFDDFRPEVHDSDGLLLAFAGGEWLWRPLDNPRTLNVSGFEMTNPKGFGLLQRDRDFDHYQDLETRADKRPSVWLEASRDGGRGP